MDTMQAEIPIWKLTLDLMTQMNDNIQTINILGMIMSLTILFVFLFVIGIYAKLDDRISKLEEKVEDVHRHDNP